MEHTWTESVPDIRRRRSSEVVGVFEADDGVQIRAKLMGVRWELVDPARTPDAIPSAAAVRPLRASMKGPPRHKIPKIDARLALRRPAAAKQEPRENRSPPPTTLPPATPPLLRPPLPRTPSLLAPAPPQESLADVKTELGQAEGAKERPLLAFCCFPLAPLPPRSSPASSSRCCSSSLLGAGGVQPDDGHHS